VFASSFLLAMSFGAIEVGYPSFGRAAGADAWGPALLAICSFGSAVGGFVYGGLHLGGSHARQLAIGMACLASGSPCTCRWSTRWRSRSRRSAPARSSRRPW
jgi:hypothetical protein